MKLLGFLGKYWFVLLTFTIVLLIMLCATEGMLGFSLGESALFYLILCMTDLTLIKMSDYKEEILTVIKERK